MSKEKELRLWSVDVSRPPKSGYRSNKTVYVGAPDLTTAIKVALEEVDEEGAWAVSAGHKGPIHRLVGWSMDE